MHAYQTKHKTTGFFRKDGMSGIAVARSRYLARPEGLEPPTFRVEVYAWVQREINREREYREREVF